MKRIAILGSTGSVGRSTLKVIASLGKQFKVVGLSAYSDIATLARQAKEFGPKWICLIDEAKANQLRARLSKGCCVLAGQEGLEYLAQNHNVDIVVLAITGAAALPSLLKAIEAAKTIVLANKEALVIAGSIIMRKTKQAGARILPVDSEQSAIWQCLEARKIKEVERIYLTASGGPLKDYSLCQLKGISHREVLCHPRWNMGRRITVDSATLMNKGLEIIEAMYLFDLKFSQIRVVIHPEAVIHSMVEFVDGMILAQMAVADMRLPIQYALTYPSRLPSNLKNLDFFKLGKINFEKPDLKRFPCLRLAMEAAEGGGTIPCVLNAADEIAVEAFLNKKINFTDIHRVIAKVMNRHRKITNPSLEEILAVDVWARGEAYRVIDKFQ